MLTQDYLKELLRYDPLTGTFTWLVQRSSHTPVGRIAGSPEQSGYIQICIHGKKYKAHRLAFLWMTGSIPAEVDHVNGQKADNSWSNLRPANRWENNQNVRLSKTSKTGFKGVSWHKQRQKFAAKIQFRGKREYLGHYDTPEDAFAAYCAAAKRLHGEFANCG